VTNTQRLAAIRAQMARALSEGKLDTYRDLLESLIILGAA